MSYLGIVLITLFVGYICGCTSVGGVLLIPSLAALSGLPLRVVMGTALFSFFFSGLVGTVMHARAGRLDLRSCVPLFVAALITGYPGALAKHHVSIAALNAILGSLIIVAGIFSLRTVQGGFMERFSGRVQKAVLVLVGAFVSFFCSMTGAGGPVLSVPIMMLLGYPPLFAIAAAIPLQVAITFSGSIGNMVVGDIDYHLAILVTVLMMAGAAAGTWSIRFFRPDPLKKAVACVCIGTGVYMVAKSLQA